MEDSDGQDGVDSRIEVVHCRHSKRTFKFMLREWLEFRILTIKLLSITGKKELEGRLYD